MLLEVNYVKKEVKIMKKTNDVKEIEKFYKKLNIDVDNKKEKTNENIFKKFIGIYDKNKTSYLDDNTILKNGWSNYGRME